MSGELRHLRFVEVLRVSGAKRVDQVLRRIEWIAGEPLLSVL